MRYLSRTFVCWIALLAASSSSAGEMGLRPLIQAHSHNDYEQAQPLVDALKLGFCNIEADIYLVEGKLLVAHPLERTHPDKTLQSLYLNPLRERIRQNGGRVY